MFELWGQKKPTRSKLIVIVNVFLFAFAIQFGPIFGQDNEMADKVDDWTSFLGTKRDGKSSVSGILKDWSGGQLKIAWEQEIGRGYVIGAVKGNRFFQFDALDQTCRLICRDTSTGSEIWTFDYEFEYKDMFKFDSGPRATPVIDDGRVYIYGVEGMLHCLNAESGEVIWKHDASKEYGVVQNFFGVGSTPIVADDKLIVMVGGSPAESQQFSGKDLASVKPNGSAVVIFDKKTGEELHRLGDDLASYSSINTYNSNGQTYGVAWLRANAIGFDVRSGEELWKYPYRARRYETVNASTPVIDGTRIFLCESYGPGSLLLEVGDGKPEVVWNDTNPRQRALATHWNTPVLHEGHLFACHGAGPGNCEIRCVELATGEVKWKQRGYARSSLTYVDKHLVVMGERGKLALVKATADSFELVSSYSNAAGDGLKLEYPCWAAPVIAGSKLYVRGKNRLVCLQLKPE